MSGRVFSPSDWSLSPTGCLPPDSKEKVKVEVFSLLNDVVVEETEGTEGLGQTCMSQNR